MRESGDDVLVTGPTATAGVGLGMDVLRFGGVAL